MAEFKDAENKKHCREKWKLTGFILAVYDAVAVNLSFFFALWFRFDCRYSAIPSVYMDEWLSFAPFYTAFCLAVYASQKLYKSIWRFAGYNELLRTGFSCAITGIIHIAATVLFFKRMPVLYYIGGTFLQFILTLGIRFSYRFIVILRRISKSDEIKENVMVIGAGAAGKTVVRELQQSRETRGTKVCCFIDDDENKWGRYISGVLVAGGRDDILLNVKKYSINKIMFAIPTASMEEKRDILSICHETDCELKSLPGIYQLANGDVSVNDIHDVTPEDLLGRDTVKVDMDAVYNYIKGKVILITGAGGSIGSDLARQIASHNPKRLVLFDMYENNVYDVEQELRKKYPSLDLVVLIGSVRDSRRVDNVFEVYRPQVVYHAAAHKHVPLMETSPCEAIKNNTIGTYKTAYAAAKFGCERFVLISTDKAVNPTNIMGASKRLCEMVIQTFDKMVKEKRMGEMPRLSYRPEADDSAILNAKTEYVAVRFGNVLGSNGSVIPLFKKQIAEGGPVTVTHPDIIRYFMTIPEAVSLVLLAGTFAKGGEIFVLDMGSPVKIDTLARNLIKLSGFIPDVDIKIEYTGLRPGEKLYEEKLMSEEGMKETPNHLIHIGCPIPFDNDTFINDIKELLRVSDENSDSIIDLVEKVCNTFHPVGTHGDKLKGEAYNRLKNEAEEKDAAILL